MRELLLCWDSPHEGGIVYRLYRNTVQFTDSSQLHDPDLTTSSNCVLDFLPTYGSYFYAVTTLSNDIENSALIPGENTINTPVIWEGAPRNSEFADYQ